MVETDNPEIFREVLETLQMGVLMISRAGKILFWNEGAQRITRHRRHEIVGHSFQDNILTHCDDLRFDLCGTECPIATVMHEGKPKSTLVHFQHKDGHRIAVQAWTVPIRNVHGSVIGVAQSFMEAHPATSSGDFPGLIPQGGLDETSRLPNREYTLFYLHEHLAGFASHRLPSGILRIRVDELAQMANSHGREAGHAMIRLLAQPLREQLDSAVFLGRWTQDEFLTFLTNCNPAELAEAARHLEDTLQHLSLQWWGDHLPVRASVGQTVVQPGDTIESLLQRAGFAHTLTSTKEASAGGFTT